MADDSKSSKAGWSDQSWYTQVAPPTPSTTNYEQLSSLLYLITKQDVTLKWDVGIPHGTQKTHTHIQVTPN